MAIYYLTLKAQANSILNLRIHLKNFTYKEFVLKKKSYSEIWINT